MSWNPTQRGILWRWTPEANESRFACCWGMSSFCRRGRRVTIYEKTCGDYLVSTRRSQDFVNILMSMRMKHTPAKLTSPLSSAFPLFDRHLLQQTISHGSAFMPLLLQGCVAKELGEILGFGELPQSQCGGQESHQFMINHLAPRS